MSLVRADRPLWAGRGGRVHQESDLGKINTAPPKSSSPTLRTLGGGTSSPLFQAPRELWCAGVWLLEEGGTGRGLPSSGSRGKGHIHVSCRRGHAGEGPVWRSPRPHPEQQCSAPGPRAEWRILRNPPKERLLKVGCSRGRGGGGGGSPATKPSEEDKTAVHKSKGQARLAAPKGFSLSLLSSQA